MPLMLGLNAVNRPELGEWCDIAATAHKNKQPWSRGYRKIEWVARPRRQPIRGMYIGWRTVFDGEAEYISDEEGTAFKQSQPHEVWLFVTSARTNPVHAFAADVRRLQAPEPPLT